MIKKSLTNRTPVRSLTVTLSQGESVVLNIRTLTVGEQIETRNKYPNRSTPNSDDQISLYLDYITKSIAERDFEEEPTIENVKLLNEKDLAILNEAIEGTTEEQKKE